MKHHKGDHTNATRRRRSQCSHQTSIVGNPADFPLAFTEAMYRNPVSGAIESMPNRHVIARADTGRALSVVSDRYSLVPHTTVLESIDNALLGLDVGPTPKGIYVSRGGAKMRAIYKFPTLEQTLSVNALDRQKDRLCVL